MPYISRFHPSLRRSIGMRSTGNKHHLGNKTLAVPDWFISPWMRMLNSESCVRRYYQYITVSWKWIAYEQTTADHARSGFQPIYLAQPRAGFANATCFAAARGAGR